MAIVKFNNRKNSTSNHNKNKLNRIVAYITDYTKTCNDLIGGAGVSEKNAVERMETVKKYYGKEGGREYIHFCISFKGKRDADTTYFIADNITQLFDGFQVLFAVHLNTKNTHVHFVINSVNVNDGHKYSQSKSDMELLKRKINEVVTSFGLNTDEVIIEENDYFDYEYEENELIEPMDFFDTEGLIRPLIYMYEDEY